MLVVAGIDTLINRRCSKICVDLTTSNIAWSGPAIKIFKTILVISIVIAPCLAILPAFAINEADSLSANIGSSFVLSLKPGSMKFAFASTNH